MDRVRLTRLRPRAHREPESTQSSLVPHNIYVAGNRTSVRLEPVIWDVLQSIANRQEIGLRDLISEVDRRRTAKNLSSAIRAYVVGYLWSKLSEDSKAA